MNEFFRFHPLYQDRVWGGRVLETAFDRHLPEGRPIGESWEIVDRPEAQSLVQNGAFAGLTLRALLTEHGASVMGPRYPRERPFPILVKWLDCRERLSLQVHPPGDLAPALKGQPKTENWFIAATAPGAGLLVGLKRGVSRGQFAKALVNQTVESCVHRFGVAVGDSILVRSGTIHAIDAGNLILEIQQNSDTTYRVYDWGRVGLDGKPRQMHVAESLASIDWDEIEPEPVRAAPAEAVIAESAEFRIRRIPLASGQTLAVHAGEQPRILSVVSGRLTTTGMANDNVLARGDNVVLPFAGAFSFAASQPTLALITENFV